MIDAVSPPFEWTTHAGTFIGVAFEGDGYYRIHVLVRGSKYVSSFGIFESADPAGNTMAEFDEWRAQHTGRVSSDVRS